MNVFNMLTFMQLWKDHHSTNFEIHASAVLEDEAFISLQSFSAKALFLKMKYTPLNS